MIWELLVQLAAAFGATVGFAVLVNAPPREFVWAGVTGAVGWGCYSLLGRGSRDPLAVTAGAFLLALVPALLVLGSEHPGHFAPGQATDLLELFARVCERMLRGWLG